MILRSRVLAAMILLSAVGLGPGGRTAPVWSCDFCSPGSADFRSIQQEVWESEAIALVEPIGPAPEGRFRFRMERRLKGAGGPEAGEEITVATAMRFFPPGMKLALFGGEDDFSDARPLMLNPSTAPFIEDVLKISPESPRPDLLRFFLPRLRSLDPWISASARQVYADAPYTEVASLGKTLNAPEVIGWLEDERTPRPSWGVLILMLANADGDEGADWIAAQIESSEWQQRRNYDALCAGFLLVRGEDGLLRLTQIAQEAIVDRRTIPAFSVMRALRFHEKERTGIPTEVMLTVIRRFLPYPDAFEAATFELRRLEDWDALTAVIAAHEGFGDEKPWLLGPFEDYLEACPSPGAKAYLERLVEDPDDLDEREIPDADPR